MGPGEKTQGLAARLGLKTSEFDTPDALALRADVDARRAALGLSEVVAFGKFGLRAGAKQTRPDSLLRLWTYPVMDSLVLNRVPDEDSACVQFPVTRSALARTDLPAGALTLDDLFISVPFQFDLATLRGLSGSEAQCVLFWANLGIWNLPPGTIPISLFWDVYPHIKDFPYDKLPVNAIYVTRNISFEQECYDFVTNAYEAPRLVQAFPYCNVTREVEIEPYETTSGIRRTDELFREYVIRNFQNSSFEGRFALRASALPTTAWTLFGLWAVVLAVIVVGGVAAIRARLQETAAELGSLE